MNRRSNLKLLAAGGLVSAFAGFHWLSKEREHPHLSIDKLLVRLNSLDLDGIETAGTWNATRTFNHLAQSVEFSMSGFPEMKSPLFRRTVGKLAYSVFQANGRMTHGLDEVIPGEVVDTDSSNIIKAHKRLIRSLEAFDQYGAPLEAHFAYGELDKQEYAKAHVMHVNNHFEEFKLT